MPFLDGQIALNLQVWEPPLIIIHISIYIIPIVLGKAVQSAGLVTSCFVKSIHLEEVSLEAVEQQWSRSLAATPT
jgi:hypothetical protein